MSIAPPDFPRRHLLGIEGLTPAVCFHDKARLGASMFGRGGLIALMVQAKARVYDMVVAETTASAKRSRSLPALRMTEAI